MERVSRPVGRPRQLDSEKSTETLILDEATRMYLEKGYQAVSMDDIAKACDITKATIYYHYRTKADLFTDAMVQLMLRIKKRSIQILSTDKPLKKRLTELALGHLRATEDLDINRFMKEAEISLDDEQLRRMEEAENQMYEVLEETLADSMKAGDIPSVSPKLAAHAFIAFLTAGKHVMINDSMKTASFETLVDKIIAFYWNGLGN